MKRLFITMVALFATVATYANSNVQKPLYIINGKVATIDEVKYLGDDLESMTVLTSKKDIKEFEHLGDTSNGVIVITLKNAEEEDLPFISADIMPQFMGGDLLAFRFPRQLPCIMICVCPFALATTSPFAFTVATLSFKIE